MRRAGRSRSIRDRSAAAIDTMGPVVRPARYPAHRRCQGAIHRRADRRSGGLDGPRALDPGQSVASHPDGRSPARVLSGTALIGRDRVARVDRFLGPGHGGSTRPATLARSCASATPRGPKRPARELNPASRLRTPPCLRHTRGECPRQESNLVCDLRRVACRPSHSKGTSRSRRPDSNRHSPASRTGALPFGHVGGSRGARIRTKCASFGGSLLSQEHTPVDAPRSEPGPMVQASARAGSLVRNFVQLAASTPPVE
jgi:hypothetical protein